jgi:transposase
MEVSERSAGDRDRLDRLIRATTDAKQRDRYRMVRLALDGQEKLRIAHLLGVAKSTVENWVYRYRNGGLDALVPFKPPGARPRLDPSQHDALRARLDSGPRPEDGVCTLRARDVQRIIAREFGVKYSLSQAYAILHRLGYSCLSPRPRHEHHDEQAQQHFKETAPLLSTCSDASPAANADASASTSWTKHDSDSRAR